MDYSKENQNRDSLSYAEKNHQLYLKQKHWKDEKYKWEAIKHFQKHWDVNAADFKAMLETSLEKTYNLLASGYFYAKAMLVMFAEEDPEATRAAFISLFDETKDLTERVAAFYCAGIISLVP